MYVSLTSMYLLYNIGTYMIYIRISQCIYIAIRSIDDTCMYRRSLFAIRSIDDTCMYRYSLYGTRYVVSRSCMYRFSRYRLVSFVSMIRLVLDLVYTYCIIS